MPESSAPLVLTVPGSAGYQPYSSKLADANGDGALDVITRWNHTVLSHAFVSVWFGDGAGAFSAPVLTQMAFESPDDIAPGDLDGDGLADLVLALGFSEVEVRLGLADGTFASHSTFLVPFSLSRLHLAHLDADEHLDLFAFGTTTVPHPQTGPMNALVRLGAGDGSFGPAMSIVGARAASAWQLIDVDGDAHLDLVTFDFLGTSIWSGNGDGTFGPEARYLSGGGVLADFDGEGLPDSLVVDDGEVRVLANRFVE